MNRYAFQEMAPYQIVDHLYDTRKDFIILGLCGKVGSGVTAVANILEERFANLHLPLPGFDNPDLYAAHEYRILYHYARENWKPFFKIRTSALITRRILAGKPEDFVQHLEGLREGITSAQGTESKSLDDIAREFFECRMECDLHAYCRKLCKDKSEPKALNAPWLLISQDKDFTECYQDAQKDATAPVEGKLPINDIPFTYDPKTQTCSFTNQALSGLFDAYIQCRNEKSEFKNAIWYLILQQYVYEFLPRVSHALWNQIREKSKSLPTQALQDIGNNLRISKQPYFESADASFCPDGYICLAEDINVAIKILRAYQLKLQASASDTKPYPHGSDEEVRTIVAIDSIKNPYESMYLKMRYTNYFLIGIYTEDHERRKRLREDEHLSDDDINAIDIIEQNSAFKREIAKLSRHQKNGDTQGGASTPLIIRQMYAQFKKHDMLDYLSYISPFILQNVASCLESADILINNRPDDQSFCHLKKTLLRYVCLIMHPALVLPTAIERCMQIASTAKLNSGCISRQVGAAITDSTYHLLSIGWNQQPEDQLPCSYRDLCELHHHWAPEGYSDYENDDKDAFQTAIKAQVEELFGKNDSPLAEKGKLPCYCFKDYLNKINGDHNQVHTRALHAEETAFLNLGSHNSRVGGGILFTTSSPCELCAKKAMYLGVSTIYYVEPYAGVSQKHVISIGKRKKRPNLVLFTGAIGTAYSKLYTPLLPQKDENEMWLSAKMDTDLLSELKRREKARDEADNTERGCL